MSKFKVIGHFGKKVIGAKRAAEERVLVKKKATKFGPRVLGSRGAKAGTNTPRPGGVPVVANLSVDRLAEILADNPAYLPTFVEQEFNRSKQGGVRRRALELFLSHVDALEPEAATKVRIRIEGYLAKNTDVDAEGNLTSRPKRGPAPPAREANAALADPSVAPDIRQSLAASIARMRAVSATPAPEPTEDP